MSMQNDASISIAARQVLRRFIFGEEGAVLVEFTIMAPMLLAMSIYVMDFGLLLYNKIEMQNAAQAGAQWAIANRVYNSSDIQVAAKNATPLAASSISVSSSQFCGCSKDSSGNAAVTSLSLTACTPNSTCNSSGVVGSYVTVSASLCSGTPCTATTYQSLIPYGLISATYNTSATVTVRVQ